MKAPAYLVQQILHSGTVHILSGPSRSKKFQWSLRFLDSLRPDDTGWINPFLGRKVHPTPHAFVTFLRGEGEVRNELDRMACEIDQIVEMSWEDVSHQDIHHRVQTILDRCGKARLIVVEPLIALFQGNSFDLYAASEFMGTLKRIARQRDVTILGIMPSSKEKEGRGYKQPQDKIFGSAGLSEAASTTFIIDPPTFCMSCEECPDEYYEYLEDDLGPCVGARRSSKSKTHSRLDVWLGQFRGDHFTRHDVSADLGGVSQKAFSRWVLSRTEFVEKFGNGRYRKRKPQ